jgi:hypothetical protein
LSCLFVERFLNFYKIGTVESGSESNQTDESQAPQSARVTKGVTAPLTSPRDKKERKDDKRIARRHSEGKLAGKQIVKEQKIKDEKEKKKKESHKEKPKGRESDRRGTSS